MIKSELLTQTTKPEIKLVTPNNIQVSRGKEKRNGDILLDTTTYSNPAIAILAQAINKSLPDTALEDKKSWLTYSVWRLSPLGTKREKIAKSVNIEGEHRVGTHLRHALENPELDDIWKRIKRKYLIEKGKAKKKQDETEPESPSASNLQQTDKNELIKLANSGLTYKQIGEKLGRLSYEQVKYLIDKLKIAQPGMITERKKRLNADSEPLFIRISGDVKRLRQDPRNLTKVQIAEELEKLIGKRLSVTTVDRAIAFLTTKGEIEKITHADVLRIHVNKNKSS